MSSEIILCGNGTVFATSRARWLWIFIVKMFCQMCMFWNTFTAACSVMLDSLLLVGSFANCNVFYVVCSKRSRDHLKFMKPYSKFLTEVTMFISNLSVIDHVHFKPHKTKLALVSIFHTILFCILHSIICLRHKHKEMPSHPANFHSTYFHPPCKW